MFRYPVLLILIVSFAPIFYVVIKFDGDVSTLEKLRPIYNPSEPIRFFNITPGLSGHGQLINDISKCRNYTNSDRVAAVGGVDSYIGQVPSMVLLEYALGDNRFSVDCSGSLINQRYVLAPAHCLKRKNLANVRLGEYDTMHNPDCDIYADCQPEPIVVAVQEIIVNQWHDIGLIRLSVELEYREFFIAPICVPALYDNMDSEIGASVSAAGWGRDTKFYMVSVQIVECANKNYPSQMCVDGQTEQKYCRDPNGPLIVARDGALYIEGVKSFGDACHQNSSIAVYTRVSYFYDWIINNLKP